MDDLPDDLAKMWFLIRRVAGLLDRSGEALFRSQLGISLAQFLVLSVVDAHPGSLSQQAIADRLGLTKGTVSKQIENAIAAGLMTVQMAPHSRRENVVALTDHGTKLVRRGDGLFEDARRATLPAISAAHMAATLSTLGALNAALENPGGTTR
jgi:DNA-binding MarR family transcriptional regulator